MHIVFYADNSATISHIHKGTPGKAQKHSLAFRKNIAEVLNKVRDALVAISWVPGHSNIPGNEEADHLAKEGAKLALSEISKLKPSWPPFTKGKLLEAWLHRWSNHQINPSSGFQPANTLPPMPSPTK